MDLVCISCSPNTPSHFSNLMWVRIRHNTRKLNIWSCNRNGVGNRLQVLAVLLPLVFISVGNFCDMYLLVRISHLAKKFPQLRFHHEIR